MLISEILTDASLLNSDKSEMTLMTNMYLFQEGDKNGGFESMDIDSGVSLLSLRQDF